MSNELFQDVIRYPNLPSLPAIAMQVLELTSDPDVEIRKIAEIVQQDQALSGKVLKTVNSSFYALSERCGSIERAMGFLGLNTVKSLVLGFSLVEMSGEIEDSGFNMQQHWRQTILGAVGAKTIAEQARVSDPDEVFSAGLFQDIGVLAMFAAMRERYISVISGQRHTQFPKAERDAFGFDHSKVGSELSAKWNLPERIVEAIKAHHDTGDSPKGTDPDMTKCVIAGALIGEIFADESARSALSRLQRKLDTFFPGRKLNAQSLVDQVSKDAVVIADQFDTSIGDIEDVGTLLDRAQDAGLEHQVSMQRQTEQLARDAVTDGLTGIPNRKQFDRELDDVFNAYQSSGDVFSVLFMDADKFKSVNDTHGHAAGDAVLVELAARGTKSVGSAGTLYRYGGEEFSAILPGVDQDQAAIIAESLRASVESPMFDLRKVEDAPDELKVTISIGVSSTSSGSASRIENGGTLVKEADEGVYAAKESGRNKVVCWSRDLGSAPADTAQAVSEPADETSSEQSTVSPSLAAPVPATLTRRDCEQVEILIVEDDPLAATLLMTLLKRTGKYKVHFFDDGSNAVDFLESAAARGELPCDVILSDLDVPGKNGLELFTIFQNMGLSDSIKFFVISGNDTSFTYNELKNKGVTGAIGKAEFVKNVGKWLGVIEDSVKAAA